jgi:hypothetical protein
MTAAKTDDLQRAQSIRGCHGIVDTIGYLPETGMTDKVCKFDH